MNKAMLMRARRSLAWIIAGVALHLFGVESSGVMLGFFVAMSLAYLFFGWSKLALLGAAVIGVAIPFSYQYSNWQSGAAQ